MTDQPKGIKLAADSPFLSSILRHQDLAKTVTRSEILKGSLVEEKLTLTFSRKYLPFRFTKLYQNREMLYALSPAACKIVVHIGIYLEFEAQTIRLTWKEVGLSKRLFYSAILELLGRTILRKQEKRREWYWVNLSLMIVGTLSQDQTDASPLKHDMNGN